MKKTETISLPVMLGVTYQVKNQEFFDLPGNKWLVGTLSWACWEILYAESGCEALRFVQNPDVFVTPSGRFWNGNTFRMSTGSAEKIKKSDK